MNNPTVYYDIADSPDYASAIHFWIPDDIEVENAKNNHQIQTKQQGGLHRLVETFIFPMDDLANAVVFDEKAD